MEMLANDKLFKILMDLKNRPPQLLLKEKSLNALDNYIHGYLAACNEFNCGAFTIAWYEEFRIYVADRCMEGSSIFDIPSAILHNGYDDCSGVDFFFELLKDFAIAKHSWHPEQKTPPLQPGEIRAFRLDINGMCRLAGSYITEHAEKYFGLPSSRESSGRGIAYAYSLSRDQIMACIVYNDNPEESGKREEYGAIINSLPVKKLMGSRLDEFSYHKILADGTVIENNT